MKKLIFIFIISLFIAVVGYIALVSLRRADIRASVEADQGELNVKLNYTVLETSEELVFGAPNSNPRIPYEGYWSMSNIEPVRFHVNQDCLLNGFPLSAGNYDMYGFPAEGDFMFAFNSEKRNDARIKPNYQSEVLRIPVTVGSSPFHVEKLIITSVQERAGIRLLLMWSDYVWEILVEENTNS